MFNSRTFNVIHKTLTKARKSREKRNPVLFQMLLLHTSAAPIKLLTAAALWLQKRFNASLSGSFQRDLGRSTSWKAPQTNRRTVRLKTLQLLNILFFCGLWISSTSQRFSSRFGLKQRASEREWEGFKRWRSFRDQTLGGSSQNCQSEK